MEIEVLGPLTVRRFGESIVPNAGKPRQILALLALRAGRVVPAPVLMEEIWGEDTPRSATTTLQTYILQLRRKIADALPPGARESAKDVLTTSFGGYALVSDDVRTDAQEFHRLVAQGGSALAAGDAGTASAVLRLGLQLWQGDALTGVPVGRVLGLEVLGLEEARMRALELRIEADLQLGRHADLVAELRVLAAQYPMNETFSAQLMLALYRSEGSWRALDEFRRLRRTLADELGVEPTPRLQRLHRAVLSGSAVLDHPDDRSAAGLDQLAG